MKINNPEVLDGMDDAVRMFVAESLGMFNYNEFGKRYSMSISPKTKKSFTMIIYENDEKVATEEFPARTVTSPNGTFKVARLINWLSLISM